MSGKKLTINLNSSERLIINDACMLFKDNDRSRMIKMLALEMATRLLREVAEKRMLEREQQLAKKERADKDAKRDSGDSGSDSKEISVSSSNGNSSALANQEDTLDKDKDSK